MPRVAPLTPAAAPAPVQATFNAVQKNLGVLPNMVATMGISPAALNGYVQLAGALAAGSLTPRQREQIALAVAEENACGYCLSAHSAIGSKVGLTAAQASAARAGHADDPKTAAVLAFARAVVQSRGGIADADYRKARDAGLSDPELAETIANVALNVFTNYFNRAFTVEVDAAFPSVRPGVGVAA